MTLPANILKLKASLDPEFKRMEVATQRIRKLLQTHADGKKLKGDEVTAWLGEIYAKMFLKGELVPDSYDYDVQTRDRRVSVKARKGSSGQSWKITSTIPRIDGDQCPTHLMFIHLADDYSIEGIWLFPWDYLLENNRFIEKKVRGGDRGFYVRIKPSADTDFLEYSNVL